MQTNNLQIAKLLRSMVAALTLNESSLFQIRAYDTAADAIEHSTSEIEDLWEEGKLDEVPGIGENLKTYLDEYFKTGKVKHFEQLMSKFPKVIYDLIDISGVGPKTALNLAKMGVRNKEDLKKKLDSGKLVKDGFSEKIAAKIKNALDGNQSKERMLLPYAAKLAEKILGYLKKSPDIVQADTLGSLRRMVATIGDLDFAASSKNPSKVIKHFVKMPGVIEVINQGESKATVRLNSGRHVDLLVGHPSSYGALLQHFTGSKNHNIRLRTFAEKKGLSLSEYGIKKVRTNKTLPCTTEEEFYNILGMGVPPPEIREDNGEIEAALKQNFPKLIELREIKGDLHLHSNFPLEPSHGPGVDSIGEIIQKAHEKGYKYVGISDHPPGFTTHSREEILKLLEKRTKFIQDLKKGIKNIHILNGLEVDILGDGTLSVPDEGLKTLDYCIAGIHSGHRGTKESLTKRILKAVESPYVDIISHPSGRILNERGSYEADWEEIFKFCAKHKKLLEINAYPNRLDLRDDLVRMALHCGAKFVINTDAHAIDQMENMPYGVAVARRGWVGKEDVVNAWEWKEFAKWFDIRV